MVSVEILSSLASGVCLWSLLSVYLYHFPPLVLKLPPSHSSRLKIAGAGCSFLHCCTTLVASSAYMMSPHPLWGSYIAIFSCCYFMYDTCHQLYHQPQTIYLVHHITCILVWLMILTYHQGYTIACEFLWVAELSNTIRIPWELSSRLGWDDWYQKLDGPNRSIYLLSRCVLLPLHLVWRTPCFLSLALPSGLPLLLWSVCFLFIAVGVHWRPKRLSLTV
jgi:hypothetical protein